MMSLSNQSTPDVNAHSQPDIHMHSFQDGGYTMVLDNLSNPPSQIFESPKKEDLPRLAVLEQELRDSRQQVMEERSKNQNCMKMITNYEEMVKSYKAVNQRDADLTKAKDEEIARLKSNSQNTLQKPTSERRYLRTLVTLAEKLQNNGLLSVHFSKKYEEWKQALNKGMPEGFVLDAEEDNEEAANIEEAPLEQLVSVEQDKPKAPVADESAAIDEQATKEAGKSAIEDSGAAKEVSTFGEEVNNEIGTQETFPAAKEVVAIENEQDNNQPGEVETSGAEEFAAIEEQTTKEPGTSAIEDSGAAEEVSTFGDEVTNEIGTHDDFLAAKKVVASEDEQDNDQPGELEASVAEEFAAIEEQAFKEAGKSAIEESGAAKEVAAFEEEVTYEIDTQEAFLAAKEVVASEDEQDNDQPGELETSVAEEFAANEEQATKEPVKPEDSSVDKEDAVIVKQATNEFGNLEASVTDEFATAEEQVTKEASVAAEEITAVEEQDTNGPVDFETSIAAEEGVSYEFSDVKLSKMGVELDEKGEEQLPQQPAKIDIISVFLPETVKILDFSISSDEDEQENSTAEVNPTSKLNADEDKSTSASCEGNYENALLTPVKNKNASTEEAVAQEEKEAAAPGSQSGRPKRKVSKPLLYSPSTYFKSNQSAVKKIQSGAVKPATNQVEETNTAGKNTIPVDIDATTGLETINIKVNDQAKFEVPENLKEKVVQGKKRARKLVTNKVGEKIKAGETAMSGNNKEKAVDQDKKKAPKKRGGRAKRVAATDLPAVGTMKETLNEEKQDASSSSSAKKMRLEPEFANSPCFGPFVFSSDVTGAQVTKPMMLYAVPYDPELHKEQAIDVNWDAMPIEFHQS